MSFVDIAKNPPPDRTLCPVGRVLAGLPDDEADALRGMLAAPVKVWPHTGEDSIQAAFAAEGYEVNDKAIRAHRTGHCPCSRITP